MSFDLNLNFNLNITFLIFTIVIVCFKRLFYDDINFFPGWMLEDQVCFLGMERYDF